ncbi:dynein heavy chain 7, axonemal-like, partial [Limulus polyphemus]|uniref:Dynein heavy chain 7, axonemal-like n=1 Tax=Limulus polyphemus TaxID=6850 RepID=A0ABM1SW36_LIMPO
MLLSSFCAQGSGAAVQDSALRTSIGTICVLPNCMNFLLSPPFSEPVHVPLHEQLAITPQLAEHYTQFITLMTNAFATHWNTQLPAFWSLVPHPQALAIDAFIDFVLRDPQETKETEEEIPAHREELMVVPKPWHKRFTIARKTIKQRLHLLNPCVCGLLHLWHRDYGSLRLLDIPFIMSKKEALDLSQFQQLIGKQLELSRDVLLKRWFTAVQNIIHQGIKRKHVPPSTNQLHLQSFFDNVAMLMTLQLQSLCKLSVEEYTEFLCTSEESHIFIIRLIAVGQQIKLEPTYHDFETVLLDVFDSLLHAVSIIPRVENRLNTEHTRILESKSPLQPVILEEMIISLKTQILTVLKEQFQHP